MQTLSWHFQRLKAMSPGEAAWRVRSELRDRVDRLVLRRRQREMPLSRVLPSQNGSAGPGFRVPAVEPGEWTSVEERAWLERLTAQADRIAAGRLSFLGIEDLHLGDPIDWHRDHRAGVAAPKRYAPSIDYRDFRETGDCKHVWEPNRHHQFVVLARAYRATGERRYAEALVDQWDHWIAANPFGIGMNWRSPLELGLRLINWVWAFDLVRDAGVMSEAFRSRVMNSVYRHVWDVARKFSRASSANNHLIGEAAGVYIAASYWPGLRNAKTQRRAGREILLREIQRQTYEDGGNKEQALGYQLFVLQLFLLSGMVARWTGDEFPQPYWNTLEKMFEFIGLLSEGGENLPLFGDCDDGYVLNLGCQHHDFRAWLSVGTVVVARPDMKRWSGEYSEPARWLLGRDGHRLYDEIAAPDDDGRIVSRAFPETGYYLLQSGHHGSSDRISVLFDCGPLGMGSLAGHGHADALSFTLRAFGADVLVDPGTYDYFTFPKWRDYFRSTRAHNTVRIDGQDQSEVLGLFLWGRKANARCIEWTPAETGGTVVGEHDGYARLTDPVTHRRTLELDDRTLTITDEIRSQGRHELQICFHLGEQCEVEPLGKNRFHIDTGRGTAVLALDSRLNVAVLRGSEDPIGGWVSRGYHRKCPSTTLVGKCSSEGAAKLTCTLRLSSPAAGQAR